MRCPGVALALAFVALAACDPEPAPARDPAGAQAYAVLTELGMGNLPMQPGSNVRRMTVAQVSHPAQIGYDTATGMLTLRRGVYRIAGYSITAFGYEMTPPQQDSVHSVPGYAFLCNVGSRGLQILGSLQDPMFSLPSHVDGVIPVPDTAVFYLGHQNGGFVGGIYLQTFKPGAGTDHVFARLVVQRLGDVPPGTPPPAPPPGEHPCWPLG
jgi:hypothetical protein